MLQQFIMDNITPKKCLIVASGVKNHGEYVELVKERLGEVLSVPEHEYARAKAEYIGGEYRTWTESPQTNIQVAFESAAWGSPDVPAFQLMQELLGSASEAACDCVSDVEEPALQRPLVQELQALGRPAGSPF